MAQVWPNAAEQRCWNHKLRNVVDAVPLKQQPDVQAAMQRMAAAESVADAEHERQAFHRAYCLRFPKACERLDRDWARMLTYYQFSEGALAASLNHERRRVALCGGAPAHECGEALQKGRTSDGDNLAFALARRTPLSEAKRARAMP